MTTTPTLELVDTNVLVYALYPTAVQHLASRTLVDRARQPGPTLCVAPQNMAELYCTITDPRRVTQPKTPDEALNILADLLALPGLVLLTVPADVVARWMQLLRQRPLTRAKVYDAQLAAVMLGNGISTIYTYNTADFRGFAGILARTP
ncbi:MAG: PIN domain-containing protein [Gemmataceae bacterium]|nr:PIN domain-containing protein [Gemmataceae bacterium]